MEKITSVNNSLIKELAKLQNKKERINQRAFLVEGKHLVDEAIKHHQLKLLITSDEKNISTSVKSILVNDQIIKKLSTTKTPQNIIGVVEIPQKSFQISDKMIVLDGVSDPGNLGTIIRTSLALGIKDIVLSDNCCDVYNEKVIRSTQGAIFQANIYIGDLEQIYKELKTKQIPIITTSLKASKTLQDLYHLDKFAIVMGNEANGISRLSELYQDDTVIIPLSNNIESLNVAVSLAIVLYNIQNK